MKNLPTITIKDGRYTCRPFVSVLCPFHNSEATIDACIRSVLAQTYGNIKFILYDDGSTDHSADIVKRYAKQNHNICLIGNTQNLWRLHARNELIKACDTEFATWIDADDIYEPNYIDIAVRAQQSGNFDITQIGRSARTTEDINDFNTWQFCPPRTCSLYGDDILPAVLSGFISTRYLLWCQLFRTSLLKACILPFEGRYYGDDLFYTVPLLHQAKSFRCVDTGIVVHRYRAGGTFAKLETMDRAGLAEMCRFHHAVASWWLSYMREHGEADNMNLLRTCVRCADIQLCAQQARKLDSMDVFLEWFCKDGHPVVGDDLEDQAYVAAVMSIFT